MMKTARFVLILGVVIAIASYAQEPSEEDQVLSLVDKGLTNLDVSTRTNLVWLYCPMNKLTHLDVSQNLSLTNLSCFGNQLTNLDVTHNARLFGLYCDGNQLTNLDVSQNVELSGLCCDQNRLSSLDVSRNIKLKRLECSYNHLTKLDISANTNLLKVEAIGNELAEIIVWWSPPSEIPVGIELNYDGNPVFKNREGKGGFVTRTPSPVFSPCVSNLQQIGLVLMIYSMDHAEKYPSSFLDMTNFVANPKIFVCPESGHESGSLSNVNDWTDYAYVSGLTEDDGASSVVAFCPPGNHNGEWGNVLFMDRTVRWITAPDFVILTNSSALFFGTTNESRLEEMQKRTRIVRGTAFREPRPAE